MLLIIKNHTYYVKKCRGYNLSEVLFTILLLSLLSALIIPNFATLLYKKQEQADINQLLSTLYFAQTQSLLTQTNITLCPVPINMSRIDERNKQCGTNWQEGYVLWQCDAEHCMKLCQFQLFNTTAQLSSSRPQLEFSAEGLTRGNNLQLHYHSLKTHFTADVIINLEGRIRVEQNNY